MKQKKITKRLFLNKKTIANLKGSDMNNLKGGSRQTDDDYTCVYAATCYETCGVGQTNPGTCLTPCGS